MIKRLLTLLSVSFFTYHSAFATGWGNWSNVTDIWVVSDETVLIKLTDTINPESCTDNDWFKLSATSLSGDRIYSTLLAALTSQQEILIFFDGPVLTINHKLSMCEFDSRWSYWH